MDAHRECPPYGMYLLTAALREEGHDVIFVDLIAEGTNSIASYLPELEDADLVGIGATSMSWPTAVTLIEQIRRVNLDLPIVLGGIHPTMFDKYILRAFPVEFIVRGEGEIAICRLVDALGGKISLSEVPNLSWKDDEGCVVRNTIKTLIPKEQLPEFPVPDYSSLPDNIYYALSIESSRGCAFDCSFCSTSYRRTWRGMDSERFVDRLEEILPFCDLTEGGVVHIIDDEFSMNVKRATEIARIIDRRGISPGLVFDSRANDLLNEDYVEAIAPFTSQFLVGAECGYDDGLKLIGKGTTCEKLDKAASILKKFGIADRADFSFVLGLPWETREEIEKTILFATGLHAKYGVRILLQWYCQIPGSKLWDEAHANGIVTEAMYDEFGFFGNYYLFQSGVKIPAKEIYEISDKVSALLMLARAQHPGKKMIEYAFPEAVAKYFPRLLESIEDNGLASLREVAGPGSKAAAQYREPVKQSAAEPPVKVGIPLRHFEGLQ
ncbi:MAG: radical SAM protein [Pseudomonadota bacterium]